MRLALTCSKVTSILSQVVQSLGFVVWFPFLLVQPLLRFAFEEKQAQHQPERDLFLGGGTI